jgi:hypothetical protein
MHPAPDNECSAYIICGDNTTGTKRLCGVAGTGFNPETRLCETLAPPTGDKLCVFARIDTTTAAPADGEGAFFHANSMTLCVAFQHCCSASAAAVLLLLH